jgi:penicillin-binding protein 1A
MLLSAIKTIAKWFSVLAFIGLLSVLLLMQVLAHIGLDLPDYKQLEEYDPPTIHG